MIIDVPIANPIRFKRVQSSYFDVGLDNVDNVLECDVIEAERSGINFIQQFRTLYSSYIKIQVVTDWEPDELKYMVMSVLYLDSNIEEVCDDQEVYQLTNLYHRTYTFQENYNAPARLILRYTDSGAAGLEAIYISEPFEIVEDPTLKMISWWNSENAFGMDYSHDHVNKISLDCMFSTYKPTTEEVVYKNQKVIEMLRGEVWRVLTLEAVLPWYLCEQLVIAMKHDRFYVNDVQFVSEKAPEIERAGNSNLYQFKAELKQTAILGYNTHDIGYTPNPEDSPFMNTTVFFTANGSVIVPINYILHVISAVRGAGLSPIYMRIGWTENGTELMGDTLFDGLMPITINPHVDLVSTRTIYFSFSGGGTEQPFIVHIDIQLIEIR